MQTEPISKITNEKKDRALVFSFMYLVLVDATDRSKATFSIRKNYEIQRLETDLFLIYHLGTKNTLITLSTVC